MWACLSLSNLVATYTSELYLPVAQHQVSHQGLCALTLYLLGYELLFSLGPQALSLKEQHLSVNVLPSMTLKCQPNWLCLFVLFVIWMLIVELFFGKAFCLVTFQPLSVQELFRYRMSLLITVHLYLELQVRMMSILWELFIFRANNIDANLTSAVKQLTLNGSFCHLIRNV